MTEAGTSRFPWRTYIVVFALVILFAAAPVLSVLFTYAVAAINGCSVNEAFVQPCMVLGMDLGGLLYGAGVMGWFMLATLPLGGGALIVWLVTLIIHRLAWARLINENRASNT